MSESPDNERRVVWGTRSFFNTKNAGETPPIQPARTPALQLHRHYLLPAGGGLLAAAFQVLVEPLERAADGVDLVFAFREAVPFLRVVLHFNGFARLLHGFHQLVGLLLRDADVAFALEHEQRSLG